MKEHQVTVMYLRHSHLQVGMAGNVCDELLPEDYFFFSCSAAVILIHIYNPSNTFSIKWKLIRYVHFPYFIYQ